jgi:diphthamide synthase (EF-2-diphthine--ammonia ligase)
VVPETFVADGPHMAKRVELEYETVWEGTRGHIEVADAWLAA